MFKQKFTTRTLTTLAMLIAIEVILSRFLSINAWNITRSASALFRW